jgi:large subunit ribosomal protein L4
MNKLNVIDITTGNSVEELELDNKWEKYFSYKNPEFVLHEYITAYLANQRQGTHSTKTRAEVRGGGRKPWAQKHTGRARQGSIRSPLWRKGGIVFGPKPRDYEIKFPKKKKTSSKISISC